MAVSLAHEQNDSEQDRKQCAPNVDSHSQDKFRWIETNGLQEHPANAVPDKVQSQQSTPLERQCATHPDEDQCSQDVPHHFVGESRVEQSRVRQPYRDSGVGSINLQTPGQVSRCTEQLLIEIVPGPTNPPAWRDDPEFVLNQEPYTRGQVLVAGPDFGTGSSREHAVWALRDYGFQAVISSRFGDIFRSNSGKQGLVTAVVPESVVEAIWAEIEAHPGLDVTVDLEAREVRCGAVRSAFEIDDYTRWRLMEGLDDIALTLQHQDAIDAFEATRESWRPTTLPARSQ